MLVKVTPHIVTIIKEQSEPVNEKEINISKCTFEFSEEITDDFVKEAYFTLNGNTYKQIIVNNECDYPGEILTQKGELEIGVVAFLVENEEEIKRYNPTPDYYSTWKGSLKEAENSEPITPTDKEQIEQMLSNINLSITKEGKIATITFTNKDGTEQTETLEDGKSIEYNWDGTSLGIRQEGDIAYEYVNLKGDKGEPGAIKMQIVNELPETGSDDTIYLVPYTTITVQTLPVTGTPYTIYIVESTGKRYVYESNQWIEITENNRYIEYLYVNNNWEIMGGIGVQVDLTDYVKNTDYATTSKGGVIKIDNSYGTNIGSGGDLRSITRTYGQYTSGNGAMFISKGTLENVITGKELVNKTYVDGLIGDIDSVLDAINGEVI